MKKNTNIFRPVRWMLVAALLIFPLPAHASADASELIVDTSFVQDKVGKPGWVLMDVRFPDEYAAGHLPGAVLLPGWISKLYADDTKRTSTVLPRLEKAIGEMGIANDSHVIVYGAVARTALNPVMFWVLEAMGCNSAFAKCTVQFYDGGIERWQEEGGAIDKAATKVKGVSFKASPGANRDVREDELMQVVEGRKKAVIIDVRSAGEYDGTDIRALRGGHIPNAVNIDVAKTFNPQSYRMLPLPELRSTYEKVPSDSRIITHCQTGGRAAYSYLVLRALGYKNVAIYHDGWRVYGSNLISPSTTRPGMIFTNST